jgi:prefoldin subunit 5
LDQRKDINAAVEQAQASISKIDKVAEQYHSAGRAIKNIGRAMQGKEPIPDIKPNGKLAQLLQAPYQSEIKRLNRSLRSVNKTLAALDRLEKAAGKSTEAERPSTKETMKRLKKQIDTERPDTPKRTRTKKKTAEI